MDNSNNLYGKDDEFAVPETQESPATFSKNIIRRLGILCTSSGTDAANPYSNTSMLNIPQYQGINVVIQLLSLIRHLQCTITLKSLTNVVKPTAHQSKAGAYSVVLKIDSADTYPCFVCVCVCVCVCVRVCMCVCVHP